MIPLPHLFPNAMAGQVQKMMLDDLVSDQSGAESWMLAMFERTPQAITFERHGMRYTVQMIPTVLAQATLALKGYTDYLAQHDYLDIGNNISRNLRKFEERLEERRNNLITEDAKLDHSHIMIVFRNETFIGVFAGIPSEVFEENNEQ